jgi:hypothetical protein
LLVITEAAFAEIRFGIEQIEAAEAVPIFAAP